MTIEPSPVAVYLAELKSRLPASRAARELLDEARDHLLATADAARAAGLDSIAAERRAVREYGQVDELAAEFLMVAVATDARRQARLQVAVTVLLAVCGISVFRLIPILRGESLALAPPPLAAFIAGTTLLGPSVVLLTLTYNPRIFEGTNWPTWLVRASATARSLFVVGLPVCAGLVADQAALLVSAPHIWLAAGVVAGLLVTTLLESRGPLAATRGPVRTSA